MSKKQLPARRTPELEPFTNPQAIIEQIENQSTGTSETDPYRARIENIMGLLLPRHGGVDEVGDAELLRQLSGGLVLETAARHTGFILGFEYCRDLMLTGISVNIGALKGGAK